MALKNIQGIDSVEVSLNKGNAAIKMKPGNTVTVKQLHDAIAKNGFATKGTALTVAGAIITEGNVTKLRVSGSNEVFTLSGDTRAASGKQVVVVGSIPEVPKDKAADTIQVKSICPDPEQKQ